MVSEPVPPPAVSERWLPALARVMARMTASVDRDGVLHALAEGLAAEFGAALARIWLYDPTDDALHDRATAGDVQDQSGSSSYLPLRSATWPVAQAMLNRQVVVIDELGPASGMRDLAWAQRVGVRALAGFPLFIGERLIGAMVLYRRQPLPPGMQTALAVLAQQAALALDHARLLDGATRQIARLTALSQITRELLAAGELEAVLRVVVDAGARLCGARGAMVSLIDAEHRYLRPAAYIGPMQAVFRDHETLGRALDETYLRESPTGRALTQGRLVVVEDYASWPGATEARARTLAAGVQAFIAAPLRVGDASIGVLWVADVAPRRFAPEDVAMVEALADQAALAIEHVRLAERSQDAAVLEERARLARDLHDAVTQSLFGVGMLARAATKQRAQGAAELDQTLERIASLAQTALVEMRLLLFELRPPQLGEEGLGAAIPTFVEAFRARTELPIRCVVETDVRLSREVETAMFRIVQEALANAAHHAHASEVTVRLAAQAGRVTALVADNGVGFDMALGQGGTVGGAGGLGLRSMQERAAAAGIRLEIESAPGVGTRVLLTAPVPGGAMPQR